MSAKKVKTPTKTEAFEADPTPIFHVTVKYYTSK